MEKNVTLANNTRGTMAARVAYISNMVRLPGRWLNQYYSQVLGRKLTMRQTWLLVNAQLAFGATVFPTEAPIVLRLACCAWMLSAMIKCKDEL